MRIIENSQVCYRSDRRGGGGGVDVEYADLKSEICFQMKVAMDINQVYTMRAWLHRTVYQHHVCHERPEPATSR